MTEPHENPLSNKNQIVVGDISGSYIAIGHGAQVIVNHLLSAAEELQRQQATESNILANAVIDYVRKLQGQLPRPDKVVAEAEPYKSLLPYRLADAPFFFGRDQAKQDLLYSLRGNKGRLTILHSESGAGKTSLLQAGLAAELLAQGHLPLYVRAWRTSPSLAVKQTLLPNLSYTPGLAEAPLRAFLGQVTDILGPDSDVFILLDQFEEFFLRVSDETMQTGFIEDLGSCVDDETLRARFLLSLRNDQFANLSDFRPRIPTIFANEFALKLLSHDEARQAITEPASMAGLSYETGLVEEILAELEKNQPNLVVLPAQLQLVCWALYKQLGDTSSRIIATAVFERMGGVEKILQNYLRRVLDREIPSGQRPQAQQVIEALVRSDRTRDVRTLDELGRDAAPAETLPPVLSHLVSARLLRVVETDGEETVAYELAHDYLVQQIELDPAVLARKAAQELLDQEVEDWQRNPKLRIGDEKLNTIKAQEKHLKFTPEARELYELSKKAQRRRRSVLLGLLGATFLGVVAAMVLYGFWTDAEDRRAVAEFAANAAETRQAEAEVAANAAETRQADARQAEAAALSAEATALFAQQNAEIGQATAVALEQTAQAARATAEQDRANAVTAQETAQAAEQAALRAQETAESEKVQAELGRAEAIVAQQTARAGEETAQAQQATAQAQQATAEAAAAQAEQARAQAEAAKAAAEAAQAAAERARAKAEADLVDAEQRVEDAQQLAGELDRLNTSRQLANQALTVIEDDVQLALLLSVEAMNSADTVQARGSLLAALTRVGDAFYLRNSATEVSSLAFSPNGEFLAAGSSDGAIRFWDVTDPANPVDFGSRLIGHMSVVWSVAVSPNGEILASTGADRRVILWDVSDPANVIKVALPLISHTDGVYVVSFGPRGDILASGGLDGSVILWKVREPDNPDLLDPVNPILPDGHTGGVTSITFSPDGSTLIAGGLDGQVIQWDLSTLRPVLLIAHEIGVWKALFDQSNSLLTIGDANGKATLWNVNKEPKLLGELFSGRSDDRVGIGMDFHPNGEMVASGADDGAIILWDVRDKTNPQTYPTRLSLHSGEVNAVAFSPTGNIMASGDSKGEIIIWNVDPDIWLERACILATRNFTEDEWNRFIGTALSYRATCPNLPFPSASPTSLSGISTSGSFSTAYLPLITKDR